MKIWNRIAFTAALSIFIWVTPNAQHIAGPACNPGRLANMCCPYWDVTVETKVGILATSSQTVTCTTGGQFKCNDCDPNKGGVLAMMMEGLNS